MPTKETDQEIIDALKDIVDSCEKEDDDIHKAKIRTWQKHEQFWHGLQFLFWSEQDEAWRSPLEWDVADTEEDLSDFDEKVVDIFRGHGESIISALAAQIPALRFLPDDADDDEDVITARTKDTVADLVQRHNKAKMVFLRALFFLALNGLVASYRYKDEDPAYGTYDVPVMGEVDKEVPSYVCKSCDYEMPQDDETQPPPQSCPSCGSTKIKQQTTQIKVPVIENIEQKPKSRVKIDVFGPLHFKVSHYARNQSECSYLLLYGDLGKDTVKEQNPDIADDIDSEGLHNTTRFASLGYLDEPEVNQNHLVTVTKAWLRPAAYYRCGNEEKRKKLQKKYPKGIRVDFIGKNKLFAGVKDEQLDNRWELGQAGLSTFIYSDAFLRPLVMIQEMRNDLVNLIHDTIQHGIPAVMADPQVVNFDSEGKFRAKPGTMYQTKAGRPGENIGNAFYETPRATLSREVAVFLHQLDQDAQFSIGSFPSIYGGPSEGKSRTFSEYAASRQMALQRLSIVWTFLTDWWVRTISGAVELYVEAMQEDEYYTKRQDDNYIKIWIRRSHLQGKTGGVEPEASETFPVSLSQKKDLIMKLIELNNEFVNQALFLPENARIIQDVLALNEFKLPGEQQRVKQSMEITQLLKEAPLSDTQSTIAPDTDIDDHQVHITTIISWATSQQGLDAADQNPQGFLNVKVHMKQHLLDLIAKTMGGGQTPPGTPPPSAQPEGQPTQ